MTHFSRVGEWEAVYNNRASGISVSTGRPEA